MKNKSLYRTLNVLIPYLWPVGRNDLRIRVTFALVSLGLAKAANVYVPLLLGQTVDQLSVTGQSSTIALGIPLAVILAYGFARWSATAFSEARDALFSRVSQNATRPRVEAWALAWLPPPVHHPVGEPEVHIAPP